MRALAALFLLLFTAFGWSDNPAPPIMLASVYEQGLDVREYWISEKLDGVRGYWDGRSLRTRSGVEIAAPQWFIENWPDFAMDGELWIGRGRFDELSGIVRSQSASDESWRKVRFMVFDLPGHPGTFSERLLAIQNTLHKLQIPWLQPIEQFRVSGPQELNNLLAELSAQGGEGLMLHHQHARYHSGRSTAILKYKLYQDAEAKVIAYAPGKGKYQGMVGALIVEDEGGRRFRLGSGLSDADRAEPPPIGSWVTYRYNGLTSGGLPRFARYLRIRPDYQPAE